MLRTHVGQGRYNKSRAHWGSPHSMYDNNEIFKIDSLSLSRGSNPFRCDNEQTFVRAWDASAYME